MVLYGIWVRVRVRVRGRGRGRVRVTSRVQCSLRKRSTETARSVTAAGEKPSPRAPGDGSA